MAVTLGGACALCKEGKSSITHLLIRNTVVKTNTTNFTVNMHGINYTNRGSRHIISGMSFSFHSLKRRFELSKAILQTQCNAF